MKLFGLTTKTIATMKYGLLQCRVEGFQDDRFRLMFIFADNQNQIIKAIPVKFRKGTKQVNLDDIWPQVEKEFQK